jgi:hypothetical protein
VLFKSALIAVILFSAVSIYRKVTAKPNMDTPFGVLEFLHWNHTWNNYKYSCPEDIGRAISLMKEAGVTWVRMDFLWDEIEPQQGEFDFKKYDAIVETLCRNDLNILGILNYSAAWAADGGWNCPPRENKLFVDYAAAVIGHYKDKIKYWEVWNEPDSSTYWQPQDGLKSYCALLKEVYTAAKKVDPGCKILNGGLANGLASVNRLYDNGAKDYFDIMNVHFFESPLHRNAIKAVSAYPGLVYKVMSRNGDGGKKIWVTEIGCPGVKGGIKVDNWWMGKNPSERKQAEWVKEVYTELLKDANVAKVFWAFFRDCQQHWDNGTDYFGLVRWDFSKKPSFKAYKDCSERWKKSK